MLSTALDSRSRCPFHRGFTFVAAAFVIVLGISTASALDPVGSLACEVDGAGNALISWVNGDLYDSITVERDGNPIAALPGAAVSYFDMAPALPAVYTIVPMGGGALAPPESCTAGGPPVDVDAWFTGYYHLAVGDATVTREPDALKISNLGSSGCDGVSIDLGDSGYGRVEFLELDPSLLPEGGAVTLDGVSVGPLGEVSTGKVRLYVTGGGFEMSADYSEAGAQTYTVTVFGPDGETLYTQPGIPNGETAVTVAAAWRWFYKEYDEDGNVTESCLLKIEPSPIHPTFGLPVNGVGVRFRPDQPVDFAPSLDQLRVRAADIDELRVVRTVARFEGWPCYGTGDAHLENQESSTGKLKISNLGSSGCDGISLASPPDDDYTSIELDAALDPADPSNEGGWIELLSVSGELHRGSMTATESNGEWAFSADYSDGGSATYTLEIYDDGQLVHSESGLTGTGATSRLKIKLFYRKYENGQLVEKCFISTEREPVTTTGGLTVMGDVVMTRPDTPVDAPDREIRLRAANLEELFVETISGSPTPGAPEFRRGDCNADGLKDIGDAIFLLDVLFSSGGPITCDDACDSNDDGGVDLGDVITWLDHLFSSGSIPAPDNCGVDTTADALGCVSYGCP